MADRNPVASKDSTSGDESDSSSSSDEDEDFDSSGNGPAPQRRSVNGTGASDGKSDEGGPAALVFVFGILDDGKSLSAQDRSWVEQTIAISQYPCVFYGFLVVLVTPSG